MKIETKFDEGDKVCWVSSEQIKDKCDTCGQKRYKETKYYITDKDWGVITGVTVSTCGERDVRYFIDVKGESSPYNNTKYEWEIFPYTPEGKQQAIDYYK